MLELDQDQKQNEQLKQAQQNFERGCHFLTQSESNGYAEASMIRAYKHLAKAVRQNPQHADYHAELGYFYLLLDNQIEAQKALYRAMDLNPDHERALELAVGLDALQNLEPDDIWFAEFQAFEQLKAPQTDSAEDYDRLYDDIEVFIKKQVQQQLERAAVLTAQLDDAIFEQHLKWLREFDYIHPAMAAKIALLDLEFDTTELYYFLEPLEKMAQQINAWLERVFQLYGLQQGLEAGEENLQLLLVQMNKEQAVSAEVHVKVDEVYDLADQLADILDLREDDLESQFLLTHYEQFIVQVNVLQERIDELS